MKQVRGPGGLLMWDADLFQTDRHPPEIDADDAEVALVDACLRYPERAEALHKALTAPQPKREYQPPAWANFPHTDNGGILPPVLLPR